MKIKFVYVPVVQKKLQGQIKDVDAAQSKEVPVVWIGMAEVIIEIFTYHILDVILFIMLSDHCFYFQKTRMGS